MGYECKILADSIAPGNPYRLTTFQIQFPRFILAELNTHRMFSRNSASSRAIPIRKQIQKIRKEPFVPLGFGRAQKGMQSGANLTGAKAWLARQTWLKARYAAIGAAWLLDKLNVHKQFANRLLEPWGWQTAIVSSTEWENFFALRANENAQPEFRKIAEMMMDARIMNMPQSLFEDEWHLPLVDPDEIRYAAIVGTMSVAAVYDYWTKVSIGRCARVSYLTHDGKRDPDADIELHDRLKANGHLSPFEHVARPFTEEEWEIVNALRLAATPHTPFATELARGASYVGNFSGWWQARQDIPNQWNFALQG